MLTFWLCQLTEVGAAACAICRDVCRRIKSSSAWAIK